MDVASTVKYINVSLSLKLGKNSVTENFVSKRIELLILKSVPMRSRGSRKKIKTLQLEYGAVFKS